MYLLVQQFLRQNRQTGLELLKQRYSLQVKRHKRYPNLVLLKYHQIDSPLGDPLVHECRGIILDEDQNWAVVSHPYHKFFNHGEGHAAQIDWKTARVQEKLDGSLMTLYFYDGEWQVATSGTPDAETPINDLGMTFKELFWRTFDDLGYHRPDPRGLLRCYMFELMAPENRVIVPHSERRLVCHGGRWIGDGEEFWPHAAAKKNKWECVRSFPITSIEDCVRAAAELNPMQQEGFVVVDGNFKRVKVKSPQYVALHHAKDGFTRRRMIEIARANEVTEFLAYFPELKAEFDAVNEAMDKIAHGAMIEWEQTCGIDDRKEFALRVKDTPWAPVLFALKSGNIVHAREWFKMSTLPAVERMLDNFC